MQQKIESMLISGFVHFLLFISSEPILKNNSAGVEIQIEIESLA